MNAATRAQPLPTKPSWAHRLRTESRYLLTGLPLALASFAVLALGLTAGAGLLVTLAGVPLLLATLRAAQAFGARERARIARLDDAPGSSPAGPHMDTTSHGRLARLADRRSWRAVAHGLVGLPVAAVTCSVSLLWWTVAVLGPCWPLYGFLLDRVNDPGARDLPELLGFDSYAGRSLVWIVVGLLAAVTLPPVIRLLARVQSSVGRSLLVA